VSPKPRINTPEELEIIQSNTAEDAARILGVHRVTIGKICKIEGITYKRKYKASTSDHRAKNKLVRKGYQTGMTVKELSIAYELPTWHIRKLVRLDLKNRLFNYMTGDVFNWLEHQCPKGMSLEEFVAVIVTDAYMEDQS
jgi:hypothetical protein